jgi:hypothetical protein
MRKADQPNISVALGLASLVAVCAVQPARAQAPRPEITARHAELSPDNFKRFPAREKEDSEDDSAESRSTAPRFFIDAGQPLTAAGIPGPPPQPPSPALTNGPYAGSPLGHDPQIAAGDTYVAVIEAHSIAFYDKSGKPLLEPGNASPYTLSSYELFQRFLAPTNKDSSINSDNINLFAGFPSNPKLPCVLANAAAQQGCINEVYDLRAAYDGKHKRFVFVGNARNQIWGCGDYTDPKCVPSPDHPYPCFDAACRMDIAKLARRYTVFAISRAEDPRQGFHTYWLPTAGDWPSMAINESRLLITENSICHDAVTCPPASTYPEIYVVATDDIAAGKSNVAVSWYLTDVDMPYAYGLRPVLSHDAGSPDYFVAPNGSLLNVWASSGPNKPLVSGSIDLGETGFIRGSVVLQSGKIFYAYSSDAWCKLMTPAPTDCPLKVRVVAVNVSWSNAKFMLSKTLDIPFGHNGPGDAPSDLVSYEMPSLEVTKNGDVVIAYLRRPVTTAAPLFNEARYSVLYHAESTTRPSAILKKGEGSASESPGKAHLDLAGQSLDPDGSTVWVTHAYARADGRYGQAWGAVKP